MNFNDDSPHSPFPFKDNVAAGEERKKGGNLAEISLRDLGLARTEDARPMIYPIFGTVSPKNNSSANGIFSFLRENWRKGRDSGGRSCLNCIMFFFFWFIGLEICGRKGEMVLHFSFKYITHDGLI